jgi:hypothetical protein
MQDKAEKMNEAFLSVQDLHRDEPSMDHKASKKSLSNYESILMSLPLKDIDFFLSEQKTTNFAAIKPFSRNLS